jgi:hypothetical protein
VRAKVEASEEKTAWEDTIYWFDVFQRTYHFESVLLCRSMRVVLRLTNDFRSTVHSGMWQAFIQEDRNLTRQLVHFGR